MVRKLIVTRVSDESGIVVVIVAVFMVVALGFTALVVDLGTVASSGARRRPRRMRPHSRARKNSSASPNPATWDAAVVKVKRYAYKNFGV